MSEQINLGGTTEIATRLLAVQPQTFDKENRTVTATISKGSPVKREYGIERLEISKQAIDLSRVIAQIAPVLNSHRYDSVLDALGVISQAWIADGALLGKLRFNATKAGREAAGMIERGEVSAVSCGYRVDVWAISDSEGRVIDPVADFGRHTEDGLIFTARRWTLLECSVVAIPADCEAVVRSSLFEIDVPLPPTPAQAALFRMLTRERMYARQEVIEANARNQHR